MANTISVTRSDIDCVVAAIRPFSTVRRNAFIKFISLSFKCERQAALKITEKLLKKGTIFKGTYAGNKIIRSKADAMSDISALDAFEAYVALLEKEKEQHTSAGIYTIHVTGAEFPHDYIFATTTGGIYEVIVFNDNGYQKLAFSERNQEKQFGDVIRLIVLTSQVKEADVESIKCKGKHRIALIRADGKKVACAMTDIIKDDEEE